MDFTGWQFCAVHATDAEVSAGSSFEMIVGSIGPDAPVNIPTAVSTKAPTYWKPGEVIPYSFTSGTLNQRNKVIQTVGEWSKYANVIFTQSELGTIRISFNPAAANWSYIGANCKTVAAANPTMNLGGVQDSSSITPWDRSIILHEFGHALGLVHEHRGAARGTPIHLSPTVMNNYYTMAFQWNSATTQALVLDLYNDVDVSNYADVDSASIMLFPIPAAATLEKTSTILQNTELSDFDRAYMTIMYPRPTPDPSVPQWTASYALKMIQADTSLSNSITSYWTSAVANVDRIRLVMDNWLVLKRVTASKRPVTPAPFPSESVPVTTPTPGPTTSTQTTIADPVPVTATQPTSDPTTPTQATTPVPVRVNTPRPKFNLLTLIQPTKLAPIVTAVSVGASQPPQNASEALLAYYHCGVPTTPSNFIYCFWPLAPTINIGLFGYVTEYREKLWTEALSAWLSSTGKNPASSFSMSNFNIVNVAKANGVDNDPTAGPKLYPTLEDMKKYDACVYFSEVYTKEAHSWTAIGNQAYDSLVHKAIMTQETETNTLPAHSVLRGIPLSRDFIPDYMEALLGTIDQRTFWATVKATVYHQVGHLLGFGHDCPTIETVGMDGYIHSAYDPDSLMVYDEKSPTTTSIIARASRGELTEDTVTPSYNDLSLLALMYPDTANKLGSFGTAWLAFNMKDSSGWLTVVNDAIGEQLKTNSLQKNTSPSSSLNVLRIQIENDLFGTRRLAKVPSDPPTTPTIPPSTPTPPVDPPSTPPDTSGIEALYNLLLHYQCGYWQPTSPPTPTDFAACFWRPKGPVTVGLFGYVTDYREALWTNTLDDWLQYCGFPPSNVKIINIGKAEGLYPDFDKCRLRYPTANDQAQFNACVYFSEVIATTAPSWSTVGSGQVDISVIAAAKADEPGIELATQVIRGVPASDQDPIPDTFKTVKKSVFWSMVTTMVYHQIGHFLGFAHEHPRNPGEGMDGYIHSGYDAYSVMKYDQNQQSPYTRESAFQSVAFILVEGEGLAIKPTYNDRSLLALMYPDDFTNGNKFETALRAFKFQDPNHWLSELEQTVNSEGRSPSFIGSSPGWNQLRVELEKDLWVNQRLAEDPNAVPPNPSPPATPVDPPSVPPSPTSPTNPLPSTEDPLIALPEYCTCDFERDYPKPALDAPPSPIVDPFWPLDNQVTIGLFGDVTEYREQRWREVFEFWLQSCGMSPDNFNIINVYAAEKLKDSTALPRTPGALDVQTYQIRVFFSELSSLPSWCSAGNTQLSSDSQSYRKQEEEGTEFATMCLRKIPTTLDDLPPQFVNFPEHFPVLVAVELHHAMGHFFGFYHEYERPPAKKQGFGYSAFDPASIMLYPHPAGIRVPSYNDLALLALMYPDSSTHTSKFATALRAFKFANWQSLLIDADAALKALHANAGTILQQFLRLGLAADLKRDERLAIPPGPLPMPPDTEPTAPDDQPQHGIGNEGNGSNAKAVGFLLELVDNMKQFFNPGGNQQFTLQFPGRFLDINSFAWDTHLAGVYGQFVKPTAVNEAEFRLVDQLYDLQDVVGGGNGINLSIVYEQVLNNLLPIFQSSALRGQQSQIRTWLMKEVSVSPWITDIMERQKAREQSLSNAIQVTTPPSALTLDPEVGMTFDPIAKGQTLNRLELSELLMRDYLFAKQDWELERDALITQANQADLGTPESRTALNDLTRKLSHITAIRNSQLASKYSEAVVRGFSHNVREYVSFMDVLAPSEALQNAKDSLRESSASSLDGSMKVYPVQMQPLDWFEGLSTSFQLEDLTSGPEVIQNQIKYKSQQVDLLQSQLVALSSNRKGDTDKLADQVKAAQNALENAQSALVAEYTNNVIEIAKTYLTSSGTLDDDSLTKVSDQSGVAKAVLAKLPGLLQQVNVAQTNLLSASRAMSQVLASQALAEATDSRQEQQRIRLQLDSLTAELKELQFRYQSLTSSSRSPPEDTTLQEVPTTPLELPTEQTSGGSRWQSISFRSTSESRSARSSRDANSRSEQWSCNLWLASGSGSAQSAHAQTFDFSQDTGEDIEIAFRATLVTVDRGGWFQPQFFKQSASFYKIRPEISWANGPVGSNRHGLLPGYPVGFIVAKDMIVRVRRSGTTAESQSSVDSSSAASAGGILCFSYSSSSSSQSNAQTSGFKSYSNGFEVKIPGPQIIGYIIEKTGPDLSQVMAAQLPDGFLISDADYDLGVTGEQSNTAANTLEVAPAQSSAAVSTNAKPNVEVAQTARKVKLIPPAAPNAASAKGKEKAVDENEQVQIAMENLLRERLNQLLGK